jgi:hypothetical protein
MTFRRTALGLIGTVLLAACGAAPEGGPTPSESTAGITETAATAPGALRAESLDTPGRALSTPRPPEDPAGDIVSGVVDLATLIAGAATANAAVLALGAAKTEKDAYSIAQDFSNNSGPTLQQLSAEQAALQGQVNALDTDVANLYNQLNQLDATLTADISVLYQFDSSLNWGAYVVAAYDLAKQAGNVTDPALLASEAKNVEEMMVNAQGGLEALIFDPPPSANDTVRSLAILSYALGLKIRMQFDAAGFPMDPAWFSARWHKLKGALYIYDTLKNPDNPAQAMPGAAQLRQFVDYVFPSVRAVNMPYPRNRTGMDAVRGGRSRSSLRA